MKKLFVLLGFLLFLRAASAQITVKLPDFTVPSNGDSISVPMDVTNFNGIGAISIKITYDPAVLTFKSIPDSIPGYFISNASGGVITIGWFRLSPLNAGNSTLLHLNFKHIAGNSDLKFSTNVSSIADTGANTLNVTFINGKVNGLNTPLVASLGDLVWYDLNHNGIQDAGESGLPGITVKLYTSSGVLSATAVTGNNGNYLFENLAPGDYYVQYMLLPGFHFSPKNAGNNNDINSKADTVTGKTVIFTLTSGEIITSWDAGMFAPTPSTAPELLVTKDDNSLFMKPVGENVTYSINFKNTGNGNLLNGTIIDTLPAGLTYVSCKGANSCGELIAGDNIIVFHLGTVAPGDSGLVNVTATVSTQQDIFLNTAYFAGVDANNIPYSVCTTDLDLADTCSTGGNGGVESKGDMAELLFKRHLNILFGRTTPILSKTSGPSGISSLHTLQDLVPVSGPFTSTSIETTPFDILGISNAVSAYSVDYQVPYLSTQRRVATVFSTITTAPNIYDHTKAVCDRLAGSNIEEIKVMNVNGHQFFAAKMHNPQANKTDYAISFSVYETAGAYFVDNKWTYPEYSVPQNATFIYNFQVWSSYYTSTIDLCQNILNKFSSYGALIYLNNNQMNPDIYIKNSKYTHDGKVNFTFENKGASRSVDLNIKYRTTQGADQISAMKSYTIGQGEVSVEVPIGIIADANISMSQPTGFKDEVYASGGTYASVNGPTSNIAQFVTNSYPQQVISNYPDGSLILAGGANINGQLNDWVSVMRSLTPNGSGYNLNGFNSIRFEASGTGTVTVLLNLTNTLNYNYYAYNVSLTGTNKVYTINLGDFREINGGIHTPIDLSNINMAGFQLSKANNAGITGFNFEIKNIAFLLGTTGVNDKLNLPAKFSLTQNYPNPFNPSTVIEFSVPQRDNMNLTIYNLLGQRVVTLVNGELEPGVHKVTFDASHLASGVYLYRLTGSQINITKKMVLTK